MTLEQCASDCVTYAYWGVEYGGECQFFLFAWCYVIMLTFKQATVVTALTLDPFMLQPNQTVISSAQETVMNTVAQETD